MGTKPFDFDAFNASLQKSMNICAGGRRDIDAAIKAGKGEVEALLKIGVFRTKDGDIRLVFVDNNEKWMSFGGDARPQLEPQDKESFRKSMARWGYTFVREFTPVAE